MVSIVLLTTEEVLQRNGFWYCLDLVWITKEIEPFEQIKPDQVLTKTLPRDVYYARYPEISRSESEDEVSITFKGFRTKHQEWKSKIYIRKFDYRTRNTSNSTFSAKYINNNSTINVVSGVTSLVDKENVNNDKRVSAFLKRLVENVPPPPFRELSASRSICIPQLLFNDIDCIDVPDYADFENDRLLQMNADEWSGPKTSTLKRTKCSTNLSSCSARSDCDQAEWYETIYGVSELCEPQENSYNAGKPASDSDFICWSEIMDMCGLKDSECQSTEAIENVISQSHYFINDNISNVSDEDDEAAYAKFSFNKLKQTLKTKAKTQDSSSIEKLNYENDELLKSIVKINHSLCKTFYQLTPMENFDGPVI